MTWTDFKRRNGEKDVIICLKFSCIFIFLIFIDNFVGSMLKKIKSAFEQTTENLNSLLLIFNCLIIIRFSLVVLMSWFFCC